MTESDFFPLIPSFHRPLYVHVVVFDDAQDNITSAYAFSSLSCHEFSSRLNVFVDILNADTAVGDIVVRNVVDIVLLNKIKGNDPRARTNDLVYPLAVVKDLAPLELVHYDLPLLGDSFLVA